MAAADFAEVDFKVAHQPLDDIAVKPVVVAEGTATGDGGRPAQAPTPVDLRRMVLDNALCHM